MNMAQINSIITPDEYFNLIKKESLTSEELTLKDAYEDHIRLSNKYEQYLSPAAQDILSEHNKNILELSSRQNGTSSYEDAVLAEFQEELQYSDYDPDKIEQYPTRKLERAGYIDATIILAILLNVGFIIALTILGK